MSSSIGESGEGAAVADDARPRSLSSKHKRIAIYGGSFNPITDAHLTMMAAIIHSRAADEVWVVPCGKRPDKPSLKTSVAHRFLMVHIAIESTFTREFPIKLCPIEFNPDAAYQTVNLFFPSPDAATLAQHPPLRTWAREAADTEFVFACGSDLITGIHTWNPDRGNWYERMGFIVFPRPGSAIPPEWSARDDVRVLGIPSDTNSVFCDSNLSSSEIRNRINALVNAGTGGVAALKARMGNYMYLAEGMLPNAVIKYILASGLLREAEAYTEPASSGGEGAAASAPPTLMLRQHSTDYEVTIAPASAGAATATRKIGILGGSFDPITNGHLKIAAEAVHSQLVDEVWIVPCGSRPDKASMRRSFNDRWTMCHLAVNATFTHDFPVKVKDSERPCAAVPKAMQTYELLEALSTEFPAKEFYFIAGTDIIPGMALWSSDELKAAVPLANDWYRKFKFMVKNRPGHGLPAAGGWWNDAPNAATGVNDNIILMKAPGREGSKVINVEMSSSLIRKQLSRSGEANLLQGIEAYCPLPVVSYIRRYRHYVANAGSPHAALKAQIAAQSAKIAAQADEIEAMKIALEDGDADSEMALLEAKKAAQADKLSRQAVKVGKLRAQIH